MGSCWEEIGCLGAPLRGRKLSYSLPSFSPVAGQDLEEGPPLGLGASFGNRLKSPDVESPLGPLKPHSHPKNWQAELDLKQMLHWCEERNRQQQHSQCPDAGRGLWVCRAASRDKGMAWTWEKQRWQARSDPNGQTEGRNGGGGSLLACRPQRALYQPTGLETPGVRAQPSCQI